MWFMTGGRGINGGRVEWCTSYILIWLSSEAVINSWESGENVKDLMGIA